MSEFANRRFQILALSGGGYRGLFTAKFLEACEEEFQGKCAERFNLIAGTSIGALLAAGLASSVPATTLAAIMEDYGPKIFHRTFATSARRFFVSAPHSQRPVLEAIRKTLGDGVASTPLSSFSPPLVITAVNNTTGETSIFRSKGVAGREASPVTIEEAVLASAAAPTFFPTRPIGPCEYIDGGLAANAPDMVAVCDALEHSKARVEEIYQLSIGTASRRQGAAVHDRARRPGAISWVARQGLIQTIMAAQEHLALSQAGTFLGNRLLRIDEEPAENQVEAVKSLDRASPEATATLKALAERAWLTRRSSRELRDFFVH